MIFRFTEEQLSFREMVRRFVTSRSPESAVRAHMTTERGYDPELWRDMAEQLGLQGLLIPEAHGGQGCGFVELAIALEEMGRQLVPSPYVASAVLATCTLLALDDETANDRLLPGLASGRSIATLAFAEPDSAWDLGRISTAAAEHGGSYRITGEKVHVLDGASADVILVAARTNEGISLFSVDGSAPGLTRTSVRSLDLTRKLARLSFADTPAQLLGRAGVATTVLSTVLDLVGVALAAEAVGGAQRCLDMAVDYAKERYQFGRPIGSFQAIKHKCSDMLLEVESARSAAYRAAWSAAEGNTDLPAIAPLAKAFCVEAFSFAARENIQVHGGIGFTWEHPAHLYYRRAKSSALLFGDAVQQRETLAERMGLGHAAPSAT